MTAATLTADHGQAPVTPFEQERQDLMQLLVSLAQPIAFEDACRLVAGKTGKPFGVDPECMLRAGGRDHLRQHFIGDIPLAYFAANEDGDRYDGTVDIERARRYASMPNGAAPPVLARMGRRSRQLHILDGGHRITAARLRGASTLKAIFSF